MRGFAQAVNALTRATLVEVWRSRLYLVVAIAGACLLAVIPGLRAAEDGDRLKLAVVWSMGVTGFVTMLLGILVAAHLVRRDHAARIVLTLFAKPLTPAGYLAGRFSGLVLTLSACALTLGLAGAAAIAWRLGSFRPRAVLAPQTCWKIEYNQRVDLPAGRSLVYCSGGQGSGAGQGLRWRFVGLEPGREAEMEVLVRAGVGGSLFGMPFTRARVAVAVIPAGTNQPGPRLALDLASPYGRPVDAGDGPCHAYDVKDRDSRRQDLERDFLRLRLGAGSIRPDGSLELQLDRLEAASVLILDRAGSCLVARPSGSFLGNHLAASLVVAVQAAMVAACTLMCAVVARLAASLLAALVLLFGGSAVQPIAEGIDWERFPVWAARLLRLMLDAMPDLDRYGISAQLAAGRAIAWTEILAASGYYGAFAALFLAGAWCGLRMGREGFTGGGGGEL